MALCETLFSSLGPYNLSCGFVKHLFSSLQQLRTTPHTLSFPPFVVTPARQRRLLSLLGHLDHSFLRVDRTTRLRTGNFLRQTVISLRRALPANIGSAAWERYRPALSERKGICRGLLGQERIETTRYYYLAALDLWFGRIWKKSGSFESWENQEKATHKSRSCDRAGDQPRRHHLTRISYHRIPDEGRTAKTCTISSLDCQHSTVGERIQGLDR